jgi:hypothetical protein
VCHNRSSRGSGVVFPKYADFIETPQAASIGVVAFISCCEQH